MELRRQIIQAFDEEFHFIKERFVVIDLLANNSPMEHRAISKLVYPSEKNNVIWHPGVYCFIGNNQLYRVGVSVNNSRHRVMQHLANHTSKNGYGIWDIEPFHDRAILLFNVKKIEDRYWLLALEAYLEAKFKPLMRAGRIG